LHFALAPFMLKNIAMTSMNRHPASSGLGIVQAMGLILLITFIYRHFGPEAHARVTPAVVLILTGGVFALVAPMALRAGNRPGR
jgi:hypothetical protein